MSSPSNQKSPCPICGRPKTPWSIKCGQCEGNRQRYLAAVERAESDRRFLENLHGRTLQAVASELGITRQRVHQMKADAERRLGFLAANPYPPVTYQTPAA